MGIIYILQPCQLIGTNRYKIGRSSKNDLSRVRSYGKNSRYLCIMECIDDIYVERLLINKFNKKYKRIAGNEYFEGCENDMLITFIDIVMKYKNKSIEIEEKINEIPDILEISDIIKTDKIPTGWMEKFKCHSFNNTTVECKNKITNDISDTIKIENLENNYATTQNNLTKNRGLKKVKWSFKILNCKIENINKISKISKISKLISKDYKIIFTNDNLEIDMTLTNPNYKSFIINSFKEVVQIDDIIIKCDNIKILEVDIYNIYDIIVNIIIDIEDKIKLLKNSVNNHSIFLELYSNTFESKINEIKKVFNYLNKDSLAFFKITDIKFLEIERQINLLDKMYSFYINYKKHLLIYIYNDNLLINNNYKLNEIITDENEMIYSLSSQCDLFNPYYNKNKDAKSIEISKDLEKEKKYIEEKSIQDIIIKENIELKIKEEEEFILEEKYLQSLIFKEAVPDVCNLLGMSSIINNKGEKIPNKSLLNKINEELDDKYGMRLCKYK